MEYKTFTLTRAALTLTRSRRVLLAERSFMSTLGVLAVSLASGLP
ncbi:MAG: hypothetical protein JWQ07_5207, partial [Ramlibacter sp.]|nr:hypothetical protein [Ramlibacter sp.]